jgi:hypothetical protein
MSRIGLRRTVDRTIFSNTLVVVLTNEREAPVTGLRVTVIDVPNLVPQVYRLSRNGKILDG